MEHLRTSGYAPINGLSMYYEIYGESEVPLVLIHGGGSTIESSFGNILPLLARSYKVIAIELQAHGRTSDRDAPESFTQDADDVAGLLKHLNIEKANILGFSNGGSTTLQIAIRHPEIVNKIIVIAGAYKRDGLLSGLFEGLANATIDDMPQPLKDAYMKVSPNKDGLQTMFEKDRDRMRSFEDWNDDDVRSIKVPALIVSGDRDVVTTAHALEMSELIAGSRLAILPGIHGEAIGEVCAFRAGTRQVEITTALIDEFLNE